MSNLTTRTAVKGYQAGLTLIELMISIVLGLLITAAAIQILVTSQSGISAQKASSDIQLDGGLGFSSFVSNVRQSNFGALSVVLPDGSNQSAFVMNSTTPLGGIVLSAVDSSASPPVTDANLMVETTNAANFFSRGGVGDSNIQGVNSDQLTIQRRIEENTFDCEGSEVAADRGDDSRILIERYFVRKASGNSSDANNLVLACKSAVYALVTVSATNPDGSTTQTKEYQYVKRQATSDSVSQISGNGEVIISNVDHFHYLLGIDTNADSMLNPDNSRVGYVTLASYMDNQKFPIPKPRIVSLKMAMVVRSTNPTNAGESSTQQNFDILDLKNKPLKTIVANGAKLQRQVFETTVLIRNARG